MSIENRRYVRVRPSGLVPKRGNIVVDARRPALACTVIDISAGGACVHMDAPSTIPDRVIFVHSGLRKSCRVAWRRGLRVGLQFEAGPVRRIGSSLRPSRLGGESRI